MVSISVIDNVFIVSGFMLLTLFIEIVLVNGWQTLYVSQDADGDIHQTVMIKVDTSDTSMLTAIIYA